MDAQEYAESPEQDVAVKVGSRVCGPLYVASTEGIVIAIDGPHAWVQVDGFKQPVTRFVADLRAVS